MGIEDTFNGAMTAFTLFHAYLNAVAEEISMERALQLQTKVCETMGAMQGQMMKEQASTEEVDIKAAVPIVKSVPESFGISMEVLEENPQSVVFKVGRCPVYEASQLLGMDAKTIEAVCRAGGAKLMAAVTRQLNPNFSYELRKFRSSADDFCEEALVQG